MSHCVDHSIVLILHCEVELAVVLQAHLFEVSTLAEADNGLVDILAALAQVHDELASSAVLGRSGLIGLELVITRSLEVDEGTVQRSDAVSRFGQNKVIASGVHHVVVGFHRLTDAIDNGQIGVAGEIVTHKCPALVDAIANKCLRLGADIVALAGLTNEV